jgi:hypothetical protein
VARHSIEVRTTSPSVSIRPGNPSRPAELDGGRTYPLAEAAEAIRYLETGHARGKIAITV